MGKNMEKAANKLIEASKYHSLRFERKFIFQDMYLEDIINHIVLTSPYGFREIFTRRSVNNIYFDDFNYSFYKQNVSGDGDRKKYRLRWYGDDFSMVKKATMEIKKKFGEVGDKYSYKLKNLQLNLNQLSADEVQNAVITELKNTDNRELLFSFQNLFPALYNTYERRYFLSSCGAFRITLDYNMKFYNPHYKDYRISEYTLESQETVFELKYETAHDKESRKLTQKWHNRMSKNSKYVNGIDFITA